MAETLLFVYVVPVVAEAALDVEDRAISGTYECAVDADTPEELLATAALDAFHDTHGVRVLDDFALVVTDDGGTELYEVDEDEGHGYTRDDLEDAARIEKIDDDVPEHAVALARSAIEQFDH